MATPPVVSQRNGVVGVFGDLEATVLALRELKAKGYDSITVYSPVPRHEIDDVLDQPVSPVRLFTLIGALTGCTLGFAYAISTSLDWELITGGKPIVSLPPRDTTRSGRGSESSCTNINPVGARPAT